MPKRQKNFPVLSSKRWFNSPLCSCNSSLMRFLLFVAYRSYHACKTAAWPENVPQKHGCAPCFRHESVCVTKWLSEGRDEMFSGSSNCVSNSRRLCSSTSFQHFYHDVWHLKTSKQKRNKNTNFPTVPPRSESPGCFPASTGEVWPQGSWIKTAVFEISEFISRPFSLSCP